MKRLNLAERSGVAPRQIFSDSRIAARQPSRIAAESSG
jgi:hypothetical protein